MKLADIMTILGGIYISLWEKLIVEMRIDTTEVQDINSFSGLESFKEVYGILWILVPILILILGIIISVLAIVWLEREISVGVQQHIGPEYAGPFGIIQSLADRIKLLFKENLIPSRGDIRLFSIGPSISIISIIISYSGKIEWTELGEEGSTDNENEWEDQKVGRRKNFLVRRMELAKHFIRTNIEPEWMVLCLLPVLPPKLRPIIQIDGGKLISSDINELYRRVIYRNNTLIDLLTTSISTPEELVMCQEKLVQEAVDTLLDNGICGQPMRDGNNKVYKLFSDIIAGKEGRFRENLLGKRVDYSGRSVIVVGPSLSLHRCGLPREIAIELFQTFLIRGLIQNHFASNIRVAKRKIREKEPIVWEMLQEVMRGHPVLLNRAPTFHRLGIQAFSIFFFFDYLINHLMRVDSLSIHFKMSMISSRTKHESFNSFGSHTQFLIGNFPIFIME
ncbi:hypothetical protein RYX36_025566 [Vicia faba]